MSFSVYFFVCLCRVVRLRVLIFKKKGRKSFEILLWVGKVEALLQALVCAWAFAACKCAYTCAMAFRILFQVSVHCLLTSLLLCCNGVTEPKLYSKIRVCGLVQAGVSIRER